MSRIKYLVERIDSADGSFESLKDQIVCGGLLGNTLVSVNQTDDGWVLVWQKPGRETRFDRGVSTRP